MKKVRQGSRKRAKKRSKPKAVRRLAETQASPRGGAAPPAEGSGLTIADDFVVEPLPKR